MNKNPFLLVGSIFLLVSLISFLIFAILAPTNFYRFSSHKIPLQRFPVCGGGCGGPPHNIDDSSYFWLDAQDDRPLYMSLHSSDTVSTALALEVFASPTHPSLTPTPSSGNHQADRYSLSSLVDSCNDCTPDEQFGPGYTVFALAQLSSTAFDIQLVGDAEQVTNTPIIYWDWNILANDPGSQVVNLLIELLWKRSGVVLHTVKVFRSSFLIQVTQPLVTLDPISIGALVSGTINAGIGAGLTIPFIWGRLEKRKRKKYASLKAVETLQPFYCMHCGHQLRQGSRFCVNCGSRIS